MKIQLLKFTILACLLQVEPKLNAQCLEASNGQYPMTVYTPSCDGVNKTIDNLCFSGEYSMVSLIAGVPYTFSSEISTDYITISDDIGEMPYTFGQGQITYTPAEDQLVRFYTHDDNQCADSDTTRSRNVICGSLPLCVVEIPYNIGFEPEDDNDCLTYEDINGGTNSGWEITDEFPTDYGDSSMTYTYDVNFAGDDWFYTPGLVLTGGASYSLSFKYRAGLGALGYTENLEVRYGTAASAEQMATTLLTLNDIDTSFDSPFEDGLATFTPQVTGTYYIGFRSFSDVNQGYIQVDEVSVGETLKRADFDIASLRYYPNPIKDVIHISYAENIQSLQISTLLGQVLLVETLNSHEGDLDLSAISSGAYLLTLFTENGTKTVKVIKQ